MPLWQSIVLYAAIAILPLLAAFLLVRQLTQRALQKAWQASERRERDAALARECPAKADEAAGAPPAQGSGQTR